MARFTPKLNKEIYSTLYNFNRKVTYNKYKTRGKGMLPELINIKDWKQKYSDKSNKEIRKQLALFREFGKRNALNKSGDSRVSHWERNYFKENRAKTLEFYNEEIADLERIIGDKPEYYLSQHARLQSLQDKRNFLLKDIDSLEETEIKTMRSVYNYAERSELSKKQGFRTYLKQLDRLLTLRQVSPSQREALLKKFDVLSENEFTEMTRNEDLITRVYELVYSPEERGEYELTVDDARADEIIEQLWGTVDELIAKYKKSK